MYRVYVIIKCQSAAFGTLHLCPAAGCLAYKKYHDLQICTRPTCRSILGDGFRKKNVFQPEVFFSEFINSIYIFPKIAEFRSLSLPV